MQKNNSKSMVTDLTTGNMTKLLLTFAFPLFVSNALQAVYNLVDMIVVGHFVQGAGMLAVSTGGDILHLLTFIAMGFSSAGQVLVAQDVGANDMDGVKHTIGTMFTLLLGISVGLSVICFFLRNSILTWVNTPAEAYKYTYDYTVTCIFGLVFIYGYNIVSAILRGMGDSRRPFVFVAIAAILNIILDVVFVKYCGMEVFGAALATVIGQGVSFAVSLVYLYIKRESFGFDFKLASFKVDRNATRRILALGIPMAIQSAAVNLSKIVLTAWINAEGVLYGAISGIYNKVNMMAGIVSNSFTTAGSTMVGQNLGAKKDKSIPEILGTVGVCSMILSVVATVVLVFFDSNVYAMFTSDTAVLAEAAIVTAPIIVNFYGSATRSMAFSLINGSGNTKLNLAVAIIDGMISRVGIAALLGFALNMRSRGFWFGDAIAGFMPFVIGGVYFISGKWRRAKS